ncbi:MAG: radical SAM protein [Candidatus Lokiarchaeota archaeon]|nr:radical SAM protein [Candidatus Lokiarchaeota archaeon]
MKKIETFTLGFTFKCNLNCKYCYEAQYMKSERKKEEFTFNELAEYVIPAMKKIKPRDLDIDGGEPILRWDDLLKFIETSFNEVKSIELVNICSNGIALTNDKIIKLQKLVSNSGKTLTFNISADTLDPNLDLRTTKIELHKKEWDAILRLKKLKIPFIAACTINKQNIETMESYLNWFKREKIYVGITPVTFPDPENHKDVLLSIKQMQKVDQLRVNWVLDPILTPDQTPNPVNPKIWKKKIEPNLRFLGLNSLFGCPAFTYALTVRANGDVKGCAMQHEVVGNLKHEDIETILNKDYPKKIRNLEIEGKCGRCRYLEQCNGGCKTRAKMETGSYLGGVNTCYYFTEKDTPHETEEHNTKILKENLNKIQEYLPNL